MHEAERSENCCAENDDVVVVLNGETGCYCWADDQDWGMQNFVFNPPEEHNANEVASDGSEDGSCNLEHALENEAKEDPDAGGKEVLYEWCEGGELISRRWFKKSQNCEEEQCDTKSSKGPCGEDCQGEELTTENCNNHTEG